MIRFLAEHGPQINLAIVMAFSGLIGLIFGWWVFGDPC